MQLESTNDTLVSEFELVGFLAVEDYAVLFFIFLLVTYLLILTANGTIFFIIYTTPHLHIPMYFLIAVLAVLEMSYTTVTMPRILVDLLRSKKSISFSGCLLQIYFFHSLGISEACLLTAMAYDRYLAICKPLNYATIMTTKLCCQLVLLCCLCGFACPLSEIILTAWLPFCHSKHINHIFCDFPPVISLACTDITTNIAVDFSLHTVVIMIPVFLILLSYTKILKVILNIQNSEGRQKAFSTCASHLTVVLIFFGTISFMYMRLSWMASVHYDRIIAVIYAFFVPLFNSIIYSLRNKEIWKVIQKMIICPTPACSNNMRLVPTTSWGWETLT